MIEYNVGNKTTQTQYINGIEWMTHIYVDDVNTKVILYDEKGEVYSEFMPKPRKKRKKKRYN